MSNQLSDPFNTLTEIQSPVGNALGKIYSLPKLQEQGIGNISRLPISIRIVLESVLRNCDGKKITEDSVKTLANWNAKSPVKEEIPFVVSRIVLQDFTGVPLLVDLAAMRDAMADQGKDPSKIEPLVPVDLVVDHSVQVDRSGTAEAFTNNLKFEFTRNKERYEFLKWGKQAFETFSVVPPAIGIVHQVNLEYLARVVFSKETEAGNILYPDTLVGTDSHTTMINGLGIVGWGVGGIEAEAGMLGQPVYFLTPEVIAVNLTGELREGVTATDLTLRVTELLREKKVVGKFIEFIGEGTERLSLSDRATIANMAPEYGATMGFFPLDDNTLNYLEITGRDNEKRDLVKAYFEAQGMWGIPKKGDIDYTEVVDLDLGTIQPSVAGPKRPQDRIELPELKSTFKRLFSAPQTEGGFGRSSDELDEATTVDFSADSFYPRKNEKAGEGKPEISNGSVLIAAITSCTNTSNPNVMIAAGLVAKNAIEKGLKLNDSVKASLAPGSRVVTDYLETTGLSQYLDELGFNLVGYGCTTCIGNSGPLDPAIEAAIQDKNLVAASVLSGNRNFEARVHGSIKSNFLMSPPLVVAYALAGTVNINLDEEPIGQGADGSDVYLKDIWPSNEEVNALVQSGVKPEAFISKYATLNDANQEWNEIQSSEGSQYVWNEDSTYIQKPPFFEKFGAEVGNIEPIHGMRPLLAFGDSVTTDHISPAGAIPDYGPAGKFLISKGVNKAQFNSFGSRRGNDQIMTRGTFANVRIKNKLAKGKEGGYTTIFPEGEEAAVYDACEVYKSRGVPLIVFAGQDYGMGSSRDWAAKGTALLGVKAVVAQSFERIHRSNLIGMGVLPLQFQEGDGWDSLGLTGEDIFDLPGLTDDLKPGQSMDLTVKRKDGSQVTITLKVRIDTAIEVDYYRNGGILPFVLRELL